MLNWIVGFCHKAAEIHVLGRRRLAPSGHRTPASAVGARRHNHRATDCCCVGNLIVYLIRLPQPRANPGHIALPSGYTRHFSLPHYALGFSRISLHPTNHFSFSTPWPSNFHPGPRLISPAYKKAVPRPCYHLTITQSGTLFW